MANISLIGLIAFFLTACNGGQAKEKLLKVEDHLTQNNQVFDREMRAPGLVRIKTDILEQQKEILILTSNEQVIDSLYSKDDSEPAFSRRINNIWSYYPEYYIVIFEAYPLDNDRFYNVVINGDIFALSHFDGITIYETWQEHLKTSFILTSKDNPLKVAPDQNAESLLFDYEELSFEVLEVKEDWIYVKCNIDCDGCPGIEVRGWIKWKEKNVLKVELRYIC